MPYSIQVHNACIFIAVFYHNLTYFITHYMPEVSWPLLETPLRMDITYTLYIFHWILLVWWQIPHFCCEIKTETVIILSLFSSSIYYIPVFNKQFLGLCFCQIIPLFSWAPVFFPWGLRNVSCPQQNPSILKNFALTFGTVHIISYRGLSTHYLLITIMQWKVWKMHFQHHCSHYTRGPQPLSSKSPPYRDRAACYVTFWPIISYVVLYICIYIIKMITLQSHYLK